MLSFYFIMSLLLFFIFCNHKISCMHTVLRYQKAVISLFIWIDRVLRRVDIYSSSYSTIHLSIYVCSVSHSVTEAWDCFVPVQGEENSKSTLRSLPYKLPSTERAWTFESFVLSSQICLGFQFVAEINLTFALLKEFCHYAFLFSLCLISCSMAFRFSMLCFRSLVLSKSYQQVIQVSG